MKTTTMRSFAVTVEFLPAGVTHCLIIATGPSVAAAVLTQMMGGRPYAEVHWFASGRDDWKASREAGHVLVLSRGGDISWNLVDGLE